MAGIRLTNVHTNENGLIDPSVYQASKTKIASELSGLYGCGIYAFNHFQRRENNILFPYILHSYGRF